MDFEEWYEGLPSMSMPEKIFAQFVWDCAKKDCGSDVKNRNPLTDERIKNLIEDGIFFGTCTEIVRAVEEIHGILGASK